MIKKHYIIIISLLIILTFGVNARSGMWIDNGVSIVDDVNGVKHTIKVTGYTRTYCNVEVDGESAKINIEGQALINGVYVYVPDIGNKGCYVFYSQYEQTGSSCTETDDGKDYYQKGTLIYYVDGKETIWSDTCAINNQKLFEKYCQYNYIFKTETYDCAGEGKVCQYGACVKKEKTPAKEESPAEEPTDDAPVEEEPQEEEEPESTTIKPEETTEQQPEEKEIVITEPVVEEITAPAKEIREEPNILKKIWSWFTNLF